MQHNWGFLRKTNIQYIVITKADVLKKKKANARVMAALKKQQNQDRAIDESL